jgi:protein-disulfide isomerase
MEPVSTQKNNKTLIIAIVIFMALAIFGAAVFGGFLSGDKVAEEQPTALTETTDQTVPATDETAVATDTATDTSAAPFVLNVADAMAARAIGNPNAPVKIVEYASMTCSHCADFNQNVLPELKTKLIDTGKVYLEFQEFPLNAPALDAALLARCLPADRYESFTGLLFKTQEDWTTRPDYITVLKQNAKLAGLSEEGADTCLKSTELRQAIGERIQKATDEWKISSTPTFVVNGGAEFIRGAMPVEEFERIVAKIEGAPEAAPATDAPAVETPAAPIEATPDVTTPEATMPVPEAVVPPAEAPAAPETVTTPEEAAPVAE